MKIIERIYDALTGEITDLERELSAKEVKEREAALAEIEKNANDKALKAAEKAALLTRLGITEDEARLLSS
jgi:hypothetical protein